MKAVRYNSKTKAWKETPISSAKSAKLRAQHSAKFLKDGTPKLIGRLSARLKHAALTKKVHVSDGQSLRVVLTPEQNP